jgi:hypothetical protein
MPDAIQTLIANLQQNRYSIVSDANVLCSYDNLIAALNEIESSVGSGFTVTDGTTNVNPATEIDFTAGATVTNLGSGIAGIAVSGTPISPANPSATAGPTAVNGSATSYMRSDAAPAVQEGSNSQPGIVEADNDTLQITSSPTIRGKRQDIAFNFSGVPGASQKFSYIANRAFTLPTSLTGSQAAIGTNPTSTLTVTFNKNGSSIGSVAFSTGGVPTFTFSSPVSFSIGDILTAVAPGSPDATGADIAVNFKGSLN